MATSRNIDHHLMVTKTELRMVKDNVTGEGSKKQKICKWRLGKKMWRHRKEKGERDMHTEIMVKYKEIICVYSFVHDSNDSVFTCVHDTMLIIHAV